jgi:hypothetical protein
MAFLILSAAAACVAISISTPKTAEADLSRPPADFALVAPPDLECDAIKNRIEERDRLMNQLVAGDVTLADAVRKVLAQDQIWPAVQPDRYYRYAGQSLGERVAGAILDRFLELPPEDPRTAEVLDRLACEQAALAELRPGWEFEPVPPRS